MIIANDGMMNLRIQGFGILRLRFGLFINFSQTKHENIQILLLTCRFIT